MGEATFFRRWMTIIAIRLGVMLVAFLIGCAPPEPIRIGFVGGTSGRVADLGIAGRNGAQLAVELRNQAGGVAGRAVELLIRDNEQNPDMAERVTAISSRKGLSPLSGR
jgi:branched-chain amino acid transport system substrate-binding protein